MHTSWKIDKNACSSVSYDRHSSNRLPNPYHFSEPYLSPIHSPVDAPSPPPHQPPDTALDAPSSPVASDFLGYHQRSPESSPAQKLFESVFDGAYVRPKPHDMDVLASQKWSRLCYQRKLLADFIAVLILRDKKNGFPFCRRTKSISTHTPKLEIVNSNLLPGLAGVKPTSKRDGVLRKGTKLCNYYGYIMTADEYSEFTEEHGVYTGVNATTLANLLPEDSAFKKEHFFVTNLSHPCHVIERLMYIFHVSVG
jgi:hypothetical protein